MILRLARGRRGKQLVLFLAAAYAVDALVGPLIVTYVTIPLLDEAARQNPALRDFAAHALSLIGR